jgi:hypothetical protein
LLDRLAAVDLLEHRPPDRYEFGDLLHAYAIEQTYPCDTRADSGAVRRPDPS